MSESSAADRVAASVNKVSVGRVYDYLLGGVHNYAVDQAFAEEQLKIIPDARNFALSNRAFLGRSVRYAIDQGIRQFIDIGSGLPTQGNVHEVADEAAPGQCRVVYIDNEPIAHAHAEILLDRTADPSRHRAIDADFFDRDEMWQRVLDTELIDPDEPVALLVVALLHFMPPETNPGAVLDYYKRQMAPGSLLVLSHIHVEPNDLEMLEASKKVSSAYKERTNSPAGPRPRPEIEAFFTGLEMVDPGLVWVPEWRPDGEDPFALEPKRARGLAGVGRKA